MSAQAGSESTMARIWLCPPHMEGGERELLLEAFDSNWIAPLGPHVNAFEEELAAVVGVPHAAAVSSGTAALHLALLLLEVKPGDRVITSTLTFAATANAIRYVGAEPVFVDVDRTSWTLDLNLLEEELRQGPPPACIMPVHLYGQTGDLPALVALADAHGVPVVEDAAEALGSTCGGRSAGSFGKMSVFSFNGNKIITTSSGGMLVSPDVDLVERTRFLATQARDPAPHYQHSNIGFNYRMSNLLAALGRGQLRHLDSKVARHRKIRDTYRERLGNIPGINFLMDSSSVRSNAWLTCLTVDPSAAGVDREAIRLHLWKHDIESRPVWKPMHLQPVFQSHSCRGGTVAERLFDTGLCLPSGSSLSEADLDRVIGAFRATPGLRV